jgi:hypothetical protein
MTIILINIVLLPMALTWKVWLSADRQYLHGSRKVLFALGLCAATLAIVEYLAFALYTARIGGFGTNFAAVFRWTRPGFWASVMAFLLLLAGRGRSRIFGVASAGMMVAMWVIIDWGM